MIKLCSALMKNELFSITLEDPFYIVTIDEESGALLFNERVPKT
jgi:hypothetical protein